MCVCACNHSNMVVITAEFYISKKDLVFLLSTAVSLYTISLPLSRAFPSPPSIEVTGQPNGP